MFFEDWYDVERTKSTHYQDSNYSVLQRYISNPGIRKVVAQYVWIEARKALEKEGS